MSRSIKLYIYSTILNRVCKPGQKEYLKGELKKKGFLGFKDSSVFHALTKEPCGQFVERLLPSSNPIFTQKFSSFLSDEYC